MASGNSHNYERSYPLIDGAPVTSGGVTYLVTGAGGNGRNTFQMAQPAYSAFRQDAFYQHTKVTVSPTELLVEGRRSDTGAVFDSTTITASGGDTTRRRSRRDCLRLPFRARRWICPGPHRPIMWA